jgi:hypothetical protein
MGRLGTELAVSEPADLGRIGGQSRKVYTPTPLTRLLQAAETKALLGLPVASAAIATDGQRCAEREERRNLRQERREQRKLALTQQSQLSTSQERRRLSQASSLYCGPNAARGGLDIEDELADAFEETRRRGVRSIAGGSLRPLKAMSARSGVIGNSKSEHNHSCDDEGSPLMKDPPLLDGGILGRLISTSVTPRGLTEHAISLLLLGRFASGKHFSAVRRATSVAATAAASATSIGVPPPLHATPQQQQTAALAADDPLQALALELFVSALASLSPVHIHQAVIMHVLQVRGHHGRGYSSCYICAFYAIALLLLRRFLLLVLHSPLIGMTDPCCLLGDVHRSHLLRALPTHALHARPNGRQCSDGPHRGPTHCSDQAFCSQSGQVGHRCYS